MVTTSNLSDPKALKTNRQSNQWEKELTSKQKKKYQNRLMKIQFNGSQNHNIVLSFWDNWHFLSSYKSRWKDFV